MSTITRTTVQCDYQPSCDENQVLETDSITARIQLDREGWTYTKGVGDCCPRHSVTVDPISKELKAVATAIFGEKLVHKTPDALVGIENVAAAIASTLWPDGPSRAEHESLRRRFIGMCLNEVQLEGDMVER